MQNSYLKYLQVTRIVGGTNLFQVIFIKQETILCVIFKNWTAAWWILENCTDSYIFMQILLVLCSLPQEQRSQSTFGQNALRSE